MENKHGVDTDFGWCLVRDIGHLDLVQTVLTLQPEPQEARRDPEEVSILPDLDRNGEDAPKRVIGSRKPDCRAALRDSDDMCYFQTLGTLCHDMYACCSCLP